MCAMSQVGDYTSKEFEKWIYKPQPYTPNVTAPIVINPPSPITRAEFDALKEKVEHMITLLEAAKIYDEKTGQPHCEVDEKVEVIKKIAEYFGVDLRGVFE
jgi:hypothetical protein